MFEQILQSLNSVVAAIPFAGATWLVLANLIFFVWLFAKASKDPHSPIRWEHLIVDSQNDRASPYKLGYLLGLIISTWVILSFVDKDKLTFDIFGLYLTFVLGGASWNAFVKSKGGERTKQDDDSSSK